MFMPAEIFAQLLPAAPEVLASWLAAAPAPDPGLLSKINAKAAEVEDTIKIVASTVIAGFVIYRIAVARLTLVSVLLAFLVGGAALFVIYNIDFAKKAVDEEVNSAPGAMMQVLDQGGRRG